MSSSGKINKEASLLRDVVFAANDGVITTFAVIAGSFGGGLSTSVVLILGFANLLADGFSMATGIYLGAKSESDFEKKKGSIHWKQDAPVLQSLVTYFSFVISGFIPLIPYVLKIQNPMLVSSLAMAAYLFTIGIIRGLITNKKPIVKGLEMLTLGGSAAIIAYFIGGIVKGFI